MRIWSVLAVASVLMTLTACETSPDAREILDQETGNTFFVVNKPLVFARERTDVAAHARDYAMLVAVAVDQSGKFSEYLLLHRWSTVDRRMREAPGATANAGALRILAEGRSIDLSPLDTVPVSLKSRPELEGPGHSDVITRAYKVDLATLRFIAGSRVLMVRLPQEPLDTAFNLWRDGRPELAKFVDAQGIREH
jgi:hypothetical protein